MLLQVRVAAAVALLLSTPMQGHASEAMTQNTLRLTLGERSPRASLETMAWLAGTWRGAGLGGESEEIWSAPRDGIMLGTYRLSKDAKAIFYEFLALAEEEGSLVIRLRHFHPDMRGWEERDAPVTMPLVAIRHARIHFDGLTFEPKGDKMTIYLAIEDRAKNSVREELFTLERVSP